MSEKHLTESAWKSFAKGKGYKEAMLLRAMTALARVDEDKPEAQIDALDELIDASEALPKLHKGDKELLAYTVEIAKAAKVQKALALKQQAELRAQKAKAASPAPTPAPAKGGAPAGADVPPVIGSKLLSTLRALQGKADVRLNAVVAIAGKQVGAAVDRNAISGAHRTALQDMLGGSGVRFIKGECIWEAKAITFVLETGAGNQLATRLKLGLAAQTGKKLKIRLRALDSEGVEETEDEAPLEAEEGDEPRAPDALPASRFEAVTAAVKNAASRGHPAAEQAKALLVQAMQLQQKDPLAAAALLAKAGSLLAAAPPPTVAPSKVAAPTVAAGETQRDYERLHAAIAPGLEALARSVAGLPSDLADQARQVQRAFALAEEQAEAGQHDKAAQILKRIAEAGQLARLQAAVSARGAPAAPATAKAKPSLVEQRIFMVTRWKRIPVDLRAEVDALRKSVAEDAGDDDPDGLAAAVSGYLESLLERLQGRLDDAVNAGDATQLKGIRQEVEADPVMVHLASNPLGDGTRFRKMVVEAIEEIESRMTA